jgi:site-specific DNA-cytosine methylase
MDILELFSGTASFSNVARERGHNCVTLDNDIKFRPDICTDILEFDVKTLNGWKPDIIWASPPCECFSVMSISRNWKKKGSRYYPLREETRLAIAYVLKTISIIQELEPKFWFIENPRAMLRKMPFMLHLPKKTITYCKYGLDYQKTTDIFTNCRAWKARRKCKANSLCHVSVKRGSELGIQAVPKSLRAIVPRELCLEIIKVCEKELNH